MAYEAAATIGMQALSTAGSGLFAKSQAAKNRRFIKRQQTHGIRRRVKDLRKAGINPIAAADGAIGGGGGGVSGGIATMPDANLGQVMNTARDAGSKKNAEDGRKTSSASTKPCDQCTNNRDQEARNQNGKEWQLIDLQKRIAAAQIPGAELQGEINQSKWGRAFAYGDRAMPAINTGLGALGVLRMGKMGMGRNTARTRGPRGGGNKMTPQQKKDWDAGVRRRDAQDAEWDAQRRNQ